MNETELRRLLGKPDQELVNLIATKLRDCEFKLARVGKLIAPTMPSYDDIVIRYDLKGRTAGWAQYPRTIALNIDLLYTHTEEIINQTLPHEYAHLVEWHLARHHDTDHNAHGPLWKFVMTKLGVPPKRTHNMETTPQRSTRKFVYSCPCGTVHNLGLTRHRRSMAGDQTYICTICRSVLIYTGKEL